MSPAMTDLIPSTQNADPYAALQAATRLHRAKHGCGAFTFEDGPALTRLAQAKQAHRILELGTALGYTACCLTHGSPHAHLDTIEGDPEHVRQARAHIAHYDLQSRITVHSGDFDAVLATLQPGYDMAFFDGFAPALHTVLHMRNLLGKGGLLICSNLQLGSGREARQLAAELADPTHWQPLAPIEGGQTHVFAKRLDGVATVTNEDGAPANKK